MKDKYVHPREQAPGIELRDWFAGMAMQGLLARYGTDASIADIASSAFTVADAMETFSEMTIEEIWEKMGDFKLKEEEND